MDTSDLAGRVGIVTGASAGIGEAVARGLFSRGASCVLNARREEKLAVLKASVPNGDVRAAIVAGDAGDSMVIAQMFNAAREKFQTEASIVVINAGRGLAGSVTNSDESQWEEMVQLNIIGAAKLMREAAKRMLKDASNERWPGRPRDIVILGSTVGRHISPFSSMYGATKFAVNSLAEALRRELGPKGIRVTLLEPGIVTTEFQEVAGYDSKTLSGFDERFGPLLTGDDIARIVSFVVTQPAHVHVNDIVIRPTRQDYP